MKDYLGFFNGEVVFKFTDVDQVDQFTKMIEETLLAHKDFIFKEYLALISAILRERDYIKSAIVKHGDYCCRIYIVRNCWYFRRDRTVEYTSMMDSSDKDKAFDRIVEFKDVKKCFVRLADGNAYIFDGVKIYDEDMVYLEVITNLLFNKQIKKYNIVEFLDSID